MVAIGGGTGRRGGGRGNVVLAGGRAGVASGWSLGSGSRGEEVEPERFGEVSGDALSPHAVACRVKRRGEGAEASLARRHGHDASGDAAFAGQAHVVEPLAGMLIQPGGGQYGQDPFAVTGLDGLVTG